MEVPGVADALQSPEMREKAEQRAESLLSKLKEAVQTDLKEIGTLRHELSVTVPANIISDQISTQFDDLRSDAVVPGFRRGKAPRALIQKRFGPDVRDSLKTSIVGQSYFAAVEKNGLEVLGDPLFRVTTDDGVKLAELGEALTHVTLPDDQDFSYTCEVEVKPKLELPELTGVEVKSPKVEITDQMVEDALMRQCKIRGRFEPLTSGAAGDDDQVIADVVLSSEGKEVKREANLQLGVRPTRLDGIALLDLGEKLKGAKVGQSIVAECTFPDDYERADLRGKPGQFKIDIHELKRLRPIELSELVEQVGAKDEAELRQFVREDLEAERDSLIARAKREQVLDYLIEKTPVDLPEKLSARQTDRAVMRTVVDLYQKGTPPSDIEATIDELRTGAAEQVARELRLQFILEKVAEKLGVRVTDEEVNTEIARIARRYGRRFDRVRDDLQRDGLLMQLAEQIRQDKSVGRILADAKVVEVDAPADEAGAGEPKAAKKKTSKKSSKQDE